MAAFAVVWAATAYWQTHKPMPAGTRIASSWVETPLSQLRLLTDTTVTDGHGRVVVRQQIFDEVFRIIDTAEQFVVLDFFLFNDQRGAAANDLPPHRALSSELKDRLIARKRARPKLQVLFVTDPINEVYGGAPSADLAELRAAGVDVVITDLDRLRDSNALYSALWRISVDWWNKDAGGAGWLPNPLETGPTRVTLRAWLRLLNFKANHRKLIVADAGNGELVGLVASANPHDASSAHSNIALRFAGPLTRELLSSELEVARFSGWQGQLQLPPRPAADPGADATARLKFLTEGAIRAALLNAIRTARPSESIAIAVFYLSDRDIVEALVAAAARDVRVRLILDPNKDAFGHTKDGVPNRPVAAELTRRSAGRIQVRWYRTHGEQFHTKLAMVRRAESIWVTLGSANFTRRNLDDFNLEANLAVETDLDTPLARQLVNYFEALWQNDALALLEYTTDFSVYEDQSFGRYWRYRLMEASGLSTF